MTQIFTGEGLGLHGSFSGNGYGSSSISGLGQGGGSIHVNVANGNLVLQQKDGFLADQGFGLGLFQTYNSKGEHSENWTFNLHTHLVFKGTPKTDGSIVQRLDEDGHISLFIFDTAQGRYIPQDGSTATLRYTGDFWEYTEKDGKVWSQYDAEGQLHSMHDLDGHHVSFSYENGRLIQVRDTVGKQNITWIFEQGRLHTVTMESEGKIIHRVAYAYDDKGRLKTLTRGVEKPFQIHYEYDGDSNRIAHLSQSDGVQYYFEYEEGKLVSIRDGQNGITRYRYEDGKTVVTLPSGQIWIYHYDEQSRLTEIEGPDQYRMQYRYENNRVASITQGSRQWRFYYNEAGDCTRTVEPSGRVITRIFDNQHRLLQEEYYIPFDGQTYPASTETRHYVYDEAGHLRFSIEPDGIVCENLYDKQGLLQEKRVWHTPFHAKNNAINVQTLEAWISRQNPEHVNIVGYEYDWRGQCTKIIQYQTVNQYGKGVMDTALITFTQYNAAGQLISKSSLLEDGLATTLYFYDDLDRLERVVDPAGTTRRFEYDDMNQRMIETDAAGLQTITHLDARGIIISVHKLAAEQDFGTTFFTLDEQGNCICETNPAGQRRWNFYNASGKLRGTVTADGQLTLYEYDHYGNLVQTRLCSQLLDVRFWDDNVSSLEPYIPNQHPEDRITRQIYDSRGFLKAVVDAEGAVIVYSINAAGQVMEKRALAQKMHSDSAMFTDDVWLPSYTAEDRCIHYYYDAAGRVQAVVDAEGYATEYKYNAAGQIMETIQHRHAINHFSGIWATDAPAFSKQDIHTYNLFNRAGLKVGEIDGEGYLTEYRYDARGLLQEKRRWYQQVSLANYPLILENLRPMPDEADQCTQYRYNAAGLCTEIREHQGLVISFTHDDLGRVIAVTRKDTHSGDTRTECKRYDGSGRLIAQLDAKGAALLQDKHLDAADIEKIWNNYGIHIQYDQADRIKSKTNARGETTRYFYNEAGLPIYTVAADGGVTETRYNAFHQIVSVLRYSRPHAESMADITLESLQKNILALRNEQQDQIIHYSYNHTGLIESIANGNHVNKSFTYNAFGEVNISKDAFNKTDYLETHYQYDKRGFLTDTLQDPSGHAVHTNNIWDAFGRLHKKRDTQESGLDYEYDKCGRIIFITRDNQDYRCITWDAFGRIMAESDWSGSRTVRWQYENNTFSKISPDGECLSISHTNAFGETIVFTDAAGKSTHYFFDEKGQNTRVEGPEGTWKNYQYDAAGQLVWQENAEGQVITYTFDAMGRVLTETLDPEGLALQKRYTFDALGRQLIIEDASGQIQRFTYNAEGLLESVSVDPDGLNLLTTFTYDAAGHMLRKTIHNSEGKDKVTAFVWDKLGQRIATIEDPDNLALTIRYVYDAVGNVIKIIDPAGNEKHYIYDNNHQCIYYIDACGVVTESRYDVNGNNTHTIKYAQTLNGTIPETAQAMLAALNKHEDDQWQCRVFDVQNRVIVHFDAGGYATSYVYDATGNVQKMIRYAKPKTLNDLKAGHFSLPSAEDSRQTLYLHDDLNRLRFTIDAMGYVREHRWNKSGLCIETIAYANRVSSLSSVPSLDTMHTSFQPDNLHDQHSYYAYDHAGRLSFQRSAEGTVTSWKYDAADRIIETVIHANSLGDTSDFTCVTKHPEDRISRILYDTAGRIIYKISAEGAVREYAYDDAGNVIEETVHFSRFTAQESSLAILKHFFRTRYDHADRSTYYAYDAAGRMISSKDALDNSTVYAYDHSGNIQHKIETGGAVWSYTYDASNRLLESRSPRVQVSRKNAEGVYSQTYSQIVTRQKYDSFGNIIARTEDAEGDARTTHYQYDLRNNLSLVQYPPVGVYERSEYASGDRQETIQTLTEQKIWNAFGELLATRDKAENWRYFIRDNAGHVCFTLDANKVLTQQKYDAFGNCVMTMTHALPLTTLPQELNFAGFARAVLSDAEDRQIWMEYDKDNRLIRTVRDAERSYNAHNRIYEQINPETQLTYNAFGEVVTKSVRLSAQDWAVSRFYYDREGQIRAEMDALGYLNTRTWNVFGECAEEIQYAVALEQNQNLHNIKVSPEDRHFSYQYDHMGHLIRKTQKQVTYQKPQGNAWISTTEDLHTHYFWDARGQMIQMQDAAGHKTHMYYDVLGQLMAKIGPVNENQTHAAVTYTYDAQGKLIETHQWNRGAAKAQEYSFTLHGEDTNDIITRNYYDAVGQLISTADGINHRMNFSYDANGHVAREWDVLHQRGEIIVRDKRHSYDAEGLLLETRTFKNSQDYYTEDFLYNTFGELQSRGVNKQFQIHLDYDRLGRVWRSNAKGYYEIYLYDATDHITQIVTASNAPDIHDVDLSASFLKDAIRFDEGTWAHSLQRQDKITDALGRTIAQRSWIEDAGLNLHEVQQTWKYDRYGNMVYHKNGSGYATTYTWNAFDVMSSKILPEVSMENEYGQIVSISPEQYFACDILGRVIAIQDANGNIIHKKYDAMGQLIEEIDATGQVTIKQYDLMGLLKSTTSSGKVTSYTYDQAKRLIAVNTADKEQRYVLDEAGHLLSHQNYDEITHYWYDAQGNLVRKQDAGQHDTVYRYDDEGHKIEERDALNNTQKWEYERGLLKSHTDLGGHTNHYTYNINGLVIDETSTRGRHIQYRYTQDGKLRQFEDKAHRETVNFTYDAQGRIKMREGGRVAAGREGWVREQETYVYDALGRLTSLQRVQPDEAFPDSLTAEYTYDAVGNIRHTKVVNKKKNCQTAASDDYYLYDANNRMLINKGSLINGKIAITASQGTALVYDTKGNIKEARVHEAGAEQVWKYWYNADNQVELMEKNGKRIQAKSYDKAGHVRQETVFDSNNNVDKIHDMHWEQGLLKGITTSNKNGFELSRETMEYDEANNRTKSVQKVHAENRNVGSIITHQYQYDRFSSYQQTRDEAWFSLEKGTTTTGLSTRTYDVNGQLQDVTDYQSDAKRESNTTHYWYSSLDGMRSKLDKNGQTHYLNFAGKTIGVLAQT